MPKYRGPNSHVASISLPVPNQSSNQKDVDSQFLTSLLINTDTNGLILKSLRHIHEPFVFSLTSQKDFPFNSSTRVKATHKDPYSENNFQTSPIAKTSVFSLNFRIPRPPYLRGIQRSFQATVAL